MKTLNIGSMNLDMVYQMDHIVQPGETEASYGMNVFLGGKGINQSVAAAQDGAVYADKEQKHYQPIFKVKAVDTTAAGDTFTGYFLAGLCEGLPIPQVLKMSAKASSIAVSRPGAVPSIPCRAEVEQALAE